MDAILNICFIFIALLPTSIILSTASFLRGSKLWAWFWTVLVILGGLGIPATQAIFNRPEYWGGPEALAPGFMFLFVVMAWLAQLIVIGIVALALRTTKHTAARREEVSPKRDFSWLLWILWIGIALIALVALTPASALLKYWSKAPIIYLSWCVHAVCTPLLPLALAFIVAGHRWKAHVWAAFWYIVAVPGAIGLVISLFAQLVQPGAMLHGGYYGARVYLVLAAVCGVVTLCLSLAARAYGPIDTSAAGRVWTLDLSLARCDSMWRWAFTWATAGYVLLTLLGLAPWAVGILS